MAVPLPPSINRRDRWVLSNVDKSTDSDIVGQFDPKLTVSRGKPRWVKKPGILGAQPWLRYLGADADRITFSFHFIANNILEKYPEYAWKKLQEWAQPDPVLGRPTMIKWQHGDEVIIGFITNVPDITVQYWHNTAKVREIGPIVLEIVEAPLPPARPSTSTNFMALTDETKFEELARSQYSDARYSQSIALLNYGAKVGEMIKLPRVSSADITLTVPASSFMEDGDL